MAPTLRMDCCLARWPCARCRRAFNGPSLLWRNNVDKQFDRRTLTILAGAMAAAPAIALSAAPAGIAQEASPEASPDASPEASPGASPVAGEQVEIVSYDIYFEPKEVTIPADTDVTIMLPNEGVTLHNFSIT